MIENSGLLINILNLLKFCLGCFLKLLIVQIYPFGIASRLLVILKDAEAFFEPISAALALLDRRLSLVERWKAD